MVSARPASGFTADAHRAAFRGAFTSPLTQQLSDAIRDRWANGGDFAALADAVVDQVAEHIRRFGVVGVDQRIAHAIADAITDHAEADYAPAQAIGQMTIEDVVGVGCACCRDARRTAERGWCATCDGAWPIDDRAVSL